LAYALSHHVLAVVLMAAAAVSHNETFGLSGKPDDAYPWT